MQNLVLNTDKEDAFESNTGMESHAESSEENTTSEVCFDVTEHIFSATSRSPAPKQSSLMAANTETSSIPKSAAAIVDNFFAERSVSVSDLLSDEIATTDSRESATKESHSTAALPAQMDMLNDCISKLHQSLVSSIEVFDKELERIQTSVAPGQHAPLTSKCTDIKQSIPDYGGMFEQHVMTMLEGLPEVVMGSVEQRPFEDAAVKVGQAMELAKLEETAQSKETVVDGHPHVDHAGGVIQERTNHSSYLSADNVRPKNAREGKKRGKSKTLNTSKQQQDSATTMHLKSRKTKHTHFNEPKLVHNDLSEIGKLSWQITTLQEEWSLASRDGSVPRVFIESAQSLYEAYHNLDKEDDSMTAERLTVLITQWEALHKAANTFHDLSSSFTADAQSLLRNTARCFGDNKYWAQGYTNASVKNRALGDELLARKWEDMALARTNANTNLLGVAKPKLEALVQKHHNYYNALQHLHTISSGQKFSGPLSYMASVTLVDCHGRIREAYGAFNLPLEDLPVHASLFPLCLVI